MKTVVDRVVQYPNRYKLTDVSTGADLGTYDFTEVPGSVQVVGTEIDAELFQGISEDLDDRVLKTDLFLQVDDGTHTVSENLVVGGVFMYKL